MTTDVAEWYVQKGARVQGPFSAAEVGRFLLLGRVRHGDRVSRDGELWEPVTQVPELVPEELLDLESVEGWRRFLDAREAGDERGAGGGVAGERGGPAFARPEADPADPADPVRGGGRSAADDAGHGIRAERRHAGAGDGAAGQDGMAARLRTEWSSADVSRAAPPSRAAGANLLPWSLLCLTLAALGVVLWLDRAALPPG